MHFIRGIGILLLVTTLITNASSKKYGRKKKEIKEPICECGVISQGSNLQNNDGSFEKYPWMVNLMDKKKNLTTFCVGTVISKSLILTSASCLMESHGNSEECPARNRVHEFCFKSRMDIAIGLPVLAETVGIFSGGGVTVKKIMPYSHSTENNAMEGLVLLRISHPLECETFPPVCLGNHKQVVHWTTGIISGWKTDYFKNESLNMTREEVQMTTIHSRNCSKIQGHRASKQAIMCPLKNESTSYCKGYAGAPVIVRMKHRFHLVGIMSKAIIDDDCEKHEIYPLICIQNYLSWIHRQIKKDENIHVVKRFTNHSH